MRARARVHGMQVEMTQLDDLAAEPAARVSAGGVPREPKIACAEYQLGLRRILHAAPHWKILRKPTAVPGTGEGPIAGWVWESEPAGSADYWLRVAELARQLPADARALMAQRSIVACCWRERVPAEDAVTSVDRLFETLQKLTEIQYLEESNATRNEDSDDPAEAPCTDA